MAEWNTGTLLETRMIAANVRSLTFKLDHFKKHVAGQHYDIRLTAPGGYQAERSYSAASAPEEEGIVEFGVQLLENGEVSPYLYQLKPGDRVEMRGPIGGHFVWETSTPGPLCLLAGGSGLVPLMSMLRHYIRQGADPTRKIALLVSARTLEHVLYREELERIKADHPNVLIAFTLTDTSPSEWQGYARRIDQAMLQEVFGPFVAHMPMVYVCGPTKFVEAGANILIDLGLNPHCIKTERFGG